METFQLTIKLTPAQLENFGIGQDKIILAKPAEGNANPNVAWLSIKPQESNTVTWEEKYGIYASTASIQNNAVLQQVSFTIPPAATNAVYTLDSAGVITGPESDGGQIGAFKLFNQYENEVAGSPMTVGLYQNASLNGTNILNSAISAASVLESQTATMTPYTSVYIWAQSQVAGNSVVTVVSGNQTELLFGGPTKEITVTYDDSQGIFVAHSGAKTAYRVIKNK